MTPQIISVHPISPTHTAIRAILGDTIAWQIVPRHEGEQATAALKDATKPR
jgi:hypothetical protein